MKNNIAVLLKPVLDKSICETFGVQVNDIMDGDRRDFLPRQTAMFILKEKYSCPDLHIKNTYQSYPATIKKACERVRGITQAGGDNAKKVAAVEASILTEALSNQELQSVLEAAKNGHSRVTNDEPTVYKRRISEPHQAGTGKKDKKFIKRLASHLHETLLDGILFAPDAEERVTKAKKLFLFFLLNDGGLSLPEIKAECTGVKEEDIWSAVGWVTVSEKQDREIGELVKSVRKSLG